MDGPRHHEHKSHSYERMIRFEEWIAKLVVPFALVAMAAAVAFGLLTSKGHVTW